jgi:hypothetical protein
MKTRKNEDVIKTYAMFLKELYEITKTPAFVSGDHLVKDKYKISPAAWTILISNKYISRTGRRKEHKNEYIWNVGEPNINMAKAILNKANKYCGKKREERKVNHIKQDNPIRWNEMVKGVNSLPNPTATKQLSEIDIQAIVNKAVKKALAPPVKIRKVLKWRNPFYWVKK